MIHSKSAVRTRVRYAETDQMGVAYYGTYPTWLEIARTEYCRERGVDYREIEREGTGLVVAEVWVRYRRPVQYDDEIIISVWVSETGRRTMTFCYEIHKDGELCSEAYTKHVFVDMMSKRPVAAAPDLVNRLTSNPEAD